MRVKRLLLLIFLCVSGTAFGQAGPDPTSPNGCVDPVGDYFHWMFMAVRPVDKPIKSFAELVQLLAPRVDGPNRFFDRDWQQLAKDKWGMTEQDLDILYFAAQQGAQGNFRKEMIEPCSILADMIYDIPPKTLNRKVLADWADHQPKGAWVYRLNDTIEMVFFEDCSNPSYRVRAITGSEPEPQAPPPQPTAPPPPPSPPTIINIPEPKPQPAPIVNVPPANISITNQHPIDNRVIVEPAKVVIMPPTVQRVIVEYKHPWDERLFWWSQTVQGAVVSSWMIHNWDFKVPGPKGETGDRGDTGASGTNGTNGSNGKDGASGSNGSDGSNGKDGTPGANGKDGTNGTNGKDGKDGQPGPPGPTGPPGKDGNCLVVGPGGTVISIDCSKIGGSPPPRP